MALHIIKITDISDSNVTFSITSVFTQNTEIGICMKDLFPTDIHVGDELRHIEHGYCDHYRNNVLIGGTHLSMTKLNKSIK